MSQSMFTFRNIVTTPLQLLAMYYICQAAYNIRMYAINTYGLVIHEFDPWFNFRATQYLADHGLSSFFKWYDYMSWSPLGRPVGTTIYPGMQMVSVFIWKVLNEVIGYEMSLNDVCCYVPVWFGVLATILVGAMTYVVTGGSRNKAVVASAVMSIIPAHIMRSVGGGYDNESVAISCLCLTFTCWCWAVSGVSNNSNDVADAMVANDPSASPPRKAARTGSTASYIFCGILTGLAYVCMVAAWGGYIFVLNMIGVHAVALVFMGRYSPQLYWTYTFWYIIGTAGAMQVPVVGWTPLKSLEQLGPFGVFIMLQMIALATSEPVIKAMGYSTVDIPASADGKQKEVKKITKMQQFTIVMQMFVLAGIVLGIVVGILWPTGYFGPLSSRVRGLFVRHTRTGNPLVDSVAEHQPASPQAYWQFLHLTCYVAPVGYAFAFLIGVVQPFLRSFQFNVKSADKKKDKSKTSVSLPKAESWTNTDPMFFVVLCATITYHFSNKMNRLMLLMGPVCSILTGIAIGGGVDMLEDEVGDLAVMIINGVDLEDVDATESSDNKSPSKSKSKESKDTVTYFEGNVYSWLMVKLTSAYNYIVIRIIRKVVLAYALFTVLQYSPAFYQYSQEMAVNMSNPSIMFQARLQDGTTIMVDDYREAYWWLRDNTPEDARVMAWWDYGYQITGIGNRTTIADGNTWNHEHIALLGRCLTSPEKRAHNIIKHLADYVLIWSGGGGDDLAKSPHMARIANSVFEDVCPGDPTCAHFGFIDRQMTPTKSMGESLLYKLHANRITPGVTVNPKLFKEVFMSKFQKVRIYKVVGVSKTSKEYTSSPENRLCDAPGSWYCTGVYPPALDKLLAKKKDFAQLEDFNAKKDQKDKEKAAKYNEEYMKRMNRGGH